jgi:hypothetical protein
VIEGGKHPFQNRIFPLGVITIFAFFLSCVALQAALAAEVSPCGNIVIEELHKLAGPLKGSDQSTSFAPKKFIPKNGDPKLLKVSEARETGVPEDGNPDGPWVEEVSGSEKGIHGGLLRKLKRTGTRWRFNIPVSAKTPLGSPHWFSLIGGAKTGYFFGFRRISSTEMTIPDVDEISGAIRELNKALIHQGDEPIGVSFYPTKETEPESEEEFVRRFAEKKELPIAVGGNIEMHDINYHLATVFLPNQILEHGARITKRLVDFVDYVREKAAQDPSLEWLEKSGVLDKIISQRAHEIDLLGNFPHFKASKLEGEMEQRAYGPAFQAMAYNLFVSMGSSPNTHLTGIFYSIASRSYRWSPVEEKQLSELTRSFLKTHPDAASDAPLWTKGRRVDGGRLATQLIDQKRGAIAKAVMNYAE